MDTSETYIKMCEKAVEIQDLITYYNGQPQFSDNSFYWCECGIAKGMNWKITNNDSISHYIWLPRQDQLQEMVNTHNNIQLSLHQLIAIADFWIGRDLQSMEQLWLAYVMKERWNKIWNGEDWVESIISAPTGIGTGNHQYLSSD